MSLDVAPATRRGPRSLPADNFGYRILVRQGWTEEEGLGPTGSGRREPVGTSLKMDRVGLGGPRAPIRVTHEHEEIERISNARTKMRAAAAPSQPMTPSMLRAKEAEHREQQRAIRHLLTR